MNLLSNTLVFVLLLAAAGVQAKLPAKKVLTLSAAKQVALAAEAEAQRRGATVVIAVVDDGGHLLLLERLDDTQVASSEVAIGKARTAAIFRRPKVFEDRIREGRVAALALPGATPLQGGLPILYEDQVIGAIGVSGNTPQEDEEIARAGLSGLDAAAKGSSGSPATYIPAVQLQAAFAKGEFLLRTEAYKVEAGRRTAPGVAEVHLGETDVFYVQEGSATFVTGGTVVDAKTISPGEIRGPSIEGGESRRIGKGDVLVVPSGTPHWFKEISGPFLYFMVKPAVGGVR